MADVQKADCLPVTHVIFDVDGLILDTEKLYTTIMQDIAGRYGKKFTWDIKVKQMGRKQAEAGQIFIDELEIPLTVEEYCEEVNRLIRVYFPHAEVMPGAEKIIKYLHSHHIPICIATGSHSEELRLKTTNHTQLFTLFHHQVCCGDDPEVKKGKPAPDCFIVAANRFPNPPAPDRVLVFEDAVNGVEAALAAGMRVVWVPDPLNPSTQSSAFTNNTRVFQYKSLNDFEPSLFGLPSFSN